MSFTNIGATVATTGATIFRAEFVGPSSVGNFTLSGVQEGDTILMVYDASNFNYPADPAAFRAVAPANDTLYAGNSSLNGHDLVALILRS